jgi:uridine kinase
VVDLGVMAEIAALLPAAGRPVLVAIDGADGAGKTTFADGLAAAIGHPAVRASVDDFHFPQAHRHALGRTGETVWSRSYDYRALRRELLDPWLAGPGSAYRCRWHDLTTDAYVEQQAVAVPEGGVLVVDGVFVQRPELRDVWDLVAYLDCPDDVRVARMAARDGGPREPEHPDHRRYLDAQMIYRDLCDPVATADLVIDNSDPSTPRVLGADIPPAGWRLEDGELVRMVRISGERGDLARRIDDLAPPV